jgi:predicted protein tyrosine phosphatase
MPDRGHPRRVLFVCEFNRRRSATAERVFAKRTDLEVRSAGTSADALARVNAHMLTWADVVFVMEDEQREALEQMFPRHPALARTICLQIRDEYLFLDAELIRLLEERVALHLATP